MRNDYSALEAGLIPGDLNAFKKNAVGKIQYHAPVVKVVKSIVKTTVEAVGDVVETAVDAVVDVVEYVGETVEATVESIKEDPVSFAIQVAAAAVGIPPPVTAAAVTAAKGGDIGDVAKAAAAAYVAPKVGAAVGSAVASEVAGSALSNTAQQTLTNAAASGAAGATSAAIQGGDIGETALRGAAGGAGGTLAGSAAAELVADSALEPYAEDVITTAERAGQVAAQGGDVESAIINKLISDQLRSDAGQSGDGQRSVEEEMAAAFEQGAATRPIEGTEMAMGGDTASDATVLPEVVVEGDAYEPEFTDQQVLDLVLGGQRRKEEDRPPLRIDITGVGDDSRDETVTGPGAESGGQVLPEVVVEGEPIEDEYVSDEQIMDLIGIGAPRGDDTVLGETVVEGDFEPDDTVMDEVVVEDDAIDDERDFDTLDEEPVAEGDKPVKPKIYGTGVVPKDRASRAGDPGVSSRVTGGEAEALREREPMFGGDEGMQAEDWNRRSLRLKRLLGL